MLYGFLHALVSALLMGCLLLAALPALPRYGQRVRLVTLAGTFAAVAMHSANSIWWYVPWSYTFFAIAAAISSWFLAGLVLARFLRPSAA